MLGMLTLIERKFEAKEYFTKEDSRWMKGYNAVLDVIVKEKIKGGMDEEEAYDKVMELFNEFPSPHSCISQYIHEYKTELFEDLMKKET